jgi:predicted membrane protein
MKWDVKACVAGTAALFLGIIAVSVAATHRANLDLPPTSTDLFYHRLGIVGFCLVFLSAIAVFFASVSFSGRFTALAALIAGTSFVAVSALIWVFSTAFRPSTELWAVIFLVPFMLGLVSGTLLLFVGLARYTIAHLRS